MSEREVDLALVKRVQKGESRAFDLLVRKYQRKIIGVISRFVSDWSEAEDVAQDAFIRAYRAMPAFRGDSAFYTWMYKIAVNTAKNHLVAQKRRPPATDVEVEDAVWFDQLARMSDGGTPEHELMRQEIEQTVTDAVQALPEELRDAINLREVDGLSYEEIATRMDCPIGTVRSRIFRAREAIDARLQPVLTGKAESES